MMTLLLFGLLRSSCHREGAGFALNRNVKSLEFHRRRLAETQELANIGGGMGHPAPSADLVGWTLSAARSRGRRSARADRPIFYQQGRASCRHSSCAQCTERVIELESPVAIECRVSCPAAKNERFSGHAARDPTRTTGSAPAWSDTVRDITDDIAPRHANASNPFLQTMMEAIPTPVFRKTPAGSSGRATTLVRVRRENA